MTKDKLKTLKDLERWKEVLQIEQNLERELLNQIESSENSVENGVDGVQVIQHIQEDVALAVEELKKELEINFIKYYRMHLASKQTINIIVDKIFGSFDNHSSQDSPILDTQGDLTLTEDTNNQKEKTE